MLMCCVGLQKDILKRVPVINAYYEGTFPSFLPLSCAGADVLLGCEQTRPRTATSLSKSLGRRLYGCYDNGIEGISASRLARYTPNRLVDFLRLVPPRRTAGRRC